MKIVFLHSLYNQCRGGAETVTQTIVKGLRQRGHELVILTLGYQDQKKIENGLIVYYLKPRNIFNYLDISHKPKGWRLVWHLLDALNYLQKERIEKILKEEQPQVVLGHNLKGLGYLVPRLLKRWRIRFIYTCHEVQLLHPAGLLHQEKLSLITYLFSRLTKKLFGSPPVVIFPSNFLKQLHQRYGFFKQSKLVVLPNPTAFENYQVVPKNESTFNLLFLGQVEKYKGLRQLIEAVKLIPEKQLRLKVVGSGNDLESAKKQAAADSRIKFWGFIPQQQLGQIMSNTDLLINPSLVLESFGLNIVEAYSFGIPVICSAKGALGELVKEEETGWLVTKLTVDQLKEKIEFCLHHPEILKAMKPKILSLAPKYSVKNYLASLEKIINES